MKTKSTSLLLLIPAIMFVSSCNKDESQPANQAAGIRIQAYNKHFSVSSNYKSGAATTASISWDTAQMVVSGFKFEAELKSLITHRDSVEFEYKWRGPQTVNLFDSTVAIGTITLQPGFYDEIEIKVEGLKQDAAGGPVFYLSGIYTSDSGQVVPIAVLIKESIFFKTERNSVEITSVDLSVFSSVIQLYLDQLMAGIDYQLLNNATLTNGRLIISAYSNAGLYRIFMQNLGRDHDCEHRKGHGHGHGG